MSKHIHLYKCKAINNVEQTANELNISVTRDSDHALLIIGYVRT